MEMTPDNTGTSGMHPSHPTTSRKDRPASVSAGILIVSASALAVVVGLAVIIVLRGREQSREEEPGGRFSYDLKALLQVDPALVKYEETGRIETGLQDPHGLDSGPGDAVFVVGDKVLRSFGKDGARLLEIELGAAPGCVEAAVAGILYVGLGDRVEVYDSKGILKSRWETLGPKSVITSICAHKDQVFVADAGQRVVWRCDPSGKPQGKIGLKDEGNDAPGFILPSPYFDLAVAPDGLLRVVNPGRHRIETYTLDGDFVGSWGKAGMGIESFSGCCNPCNFALLPSGGFVTCEKGLPRVKVHDEKGALAAVVAGPDRFVEGDRALGEDWRQGSKGGLDVAVDSRGRVLVLDPPAKVVRIFTKKAEKP
jgi:hypothetical protein